MEGGRIFHGMPPGVRLPAEQAEIPLIVKSSVPVSIARRAEYGQQDVFDTVVNLFSIQTPLFDTSGSFIKRTRAHARFPSRQPAVARSIGELGIRRSILASPSCELRLRRFTTGRSSFIQRREVPAYAIAGAVGHGRRAG